MRIIYRPHRGGLEEAMNESKIFNSINQMLEHIVNNYNSFCIKPITKDDVSFHLYHEEEDPRIGWKCVYIVMINTHTEGIRPYGFFTDEYEEDWLDIYNNWISSEH